MNNLEKNGTRVGAVGTAIVWILVTVLGFVIKIAPPHPEYKVIEITLSTPQNRPTIVPKGNPEVPKESVPVKTEPASLPKTQETPTTTQAKSSVTKPSAVKPAATIPSTAKPAQAPAATTPREEPALSKSIDELMAENKSTPKKQVAFDDSLFADESDFVESKTTTTNNVTASASKSTSSFEGTAASGATGVASKSSAISASSSAARQSTGTASSSTTAALGKIASATYVQSAGGGVTSSTSISSGSKNGRVAIQMADGSARELLSPAKPSISISEKNAALIDSTRKVTIVFKVLAGGTVPLSSIEIRPASQLPLEIQTEIKQQISTWRFASDSYDGQATFEYSIIKE